VTSAARTARRRRRRFWWWTVIGSSPLDRLIPVLITRGGNDVEKLERHQKLRENQRLLLAWGEARSAKSSGGRDAVLWRVERRRDRRGAAGFGPTRPGATGGWRGLGHHSGREPSPKKIRSGDSF
jgi:hypothetical protein